MANNIINKESDSSTEINSTVEQSELTAPTPITPGTIISDGIKYTSPEYKSNYYIQSAIHENNKLDVLNTGLYYPGSSTVIYAIEDGNRKKINIGYGCTMQNTTKYTYNANSTTYVSAIANLPGIYLWGRQNDLKDKYCWEENSVQYTAIEIERGSIPTVLKRHLEYTPWSTWDEKNRFASVSFGGTILGSRSENVLGSILRTKNKLTIEYTKNKTKHTLEFSKTDFWDKVIPTRLVVAIQGAGGSGGSGMVHQAGGGGGSGGFWLGVINLDNKHTSWSFSLGQAGTAVRASLVDAGGNNGIKGKNTSLYCNNTLSTRGIPQDSVPVFGGSGGSYNGTGGAGASKAAVSTISASGWEGLWTLANLAGARGGNRTSDGDNVSDATYYLSKNDVANYYPRNQFKLSSHDGGTGWAGGGGAASYSGDGGDGASDESTDTDGASGKEGAGGGGAFGLFAYSGAGGVATISFYY